MKINTEHLEALQKQNALKPQNQAEAGDFETLLTQEVSRVAEPGNVKPVYGMEMLGGILALEQIQAVDGVKDPEQELMNDLENLLGRWEDYSERIKGRGPAYDLRGAFGLLESISADVDQIKGRFPNIAQLQPQLQGILNEFDVMAVTEKFKFNRGDYL